MIPIINITKRQQSEAKLRFITRRNLINSFITSSKSSKLLRVTFLINLKKNKVVCFVFLLLIKMGNLLQWYKLEKYTLYLNYAVSDLFVKSRNVSEY